MNPLKRLPIYGIKITLLMPLLVCVCMGVAQAQDAAVDIPLEEISTPQKDIAAINSHTSAVKKRRVCKTIIRKGNSLIEANPITRTGPAGITRNWLL